MMTRWLRNEDEHEWLQVVEVIRKPKVILEYNMYMGGVDKGDQLIIYYGFLHRKNKWYKRAFYTVLKLP